ncbi:S-adenosyl-L-methionine-dependent methyltransferase [Xylaria digitata]|nr:S-adenosyl-L-methionine-dependent methyltransferase [Xylaria digitata]
MLASYIGKIKIFEPRLWVIIIEDDNPIIVLDEDDYGNEELPPLEQGLRGLRSARHTGARIPVIDLTGIEEREKEVSQYETQIIERLDRAGSSNLYRYRLTAPLRNPFIPKRSQISSFRYKNMLIRHGTVVEVPQRPRDAYCWQFIHVVMLYTDNLSDHVVLRGIKLTRNRHLRGMLPRMKNEVCALYDIDEDDDRPDHLQASEEILATEVIKTRAFCRTNEAFPKHRFNPEQWETMEAVENRGILVQRWKYCRYWPTYGAMRTKKSFKGAIIRLRSTDIEDEIFRVADDKLRNKFRGGIVRGGSFRGGRACVPTVNLGTAGAGEDGGAVAILGDNQSYTADDMFCGAGGASCGIRQAGLRIMLACDSDEAACKTYRKNIPEASLKQMNILELSGELETPTAHPDTLHISPPCQVFSPAHTCTGKNDEANIAALYACAEVLQIRRPRISTGEQTFGLLFDRNEEFFNALVGQYTALGYSFSWDILRFQEYGVPSIRRRLIWIASCPGEALPPFPMPTNAENNRDLPPPVTIRDVLASIEPGNRDPLHDVQGMLLKAKNSKKFPRGPYDDRCQVGTITTSGSEWAHNSGERNFTLRELACLQGFPMNYTFLGSMTQISRQIGNAFPPVVVEILYRHLRKWLLDQDFVVPRRRENSQANSMITTERQYRQDVIVVDPIDKVAAVPRPSKSTINNVEDVILVDDSENVDMTDAIDLVSDYPNFSRESSRTLSAESLPSLIEMEVGEARAHRRASFYYT